MKPNPTFQGPFVGPHPYALYGGPDGKSMARIAGAKTMEEIEDMIWTHSKSYPGTVYRVFKAAWEEVQRDG